MKAFSACSLIGLCLCLSGLSDVQAQSDSVKVQDELEKVFEEFDEEALAEEGERLAQWLIDLNEKPGFEFISRVQTVLQRQEGYERADSSGGYLGSPLRYFQRMRYKSKRVSLNLSQEKDAGEALGRVPAFDFTSMHLSVQDAGVLRHLVIGDYALNFGQGLLLWNGGAFGKGREVIRGPQRRRSGIRAYASAQETDFFRGAAVSVGRELQATVFYSDRRRTASPLTDSTYRFPTSSGLHRTQNEFGRRNNLHQLTAGGRVAFQRKEFQIGLNALSNRFNRPVRSTDPNAFSGQLNRVISTDAIFNTGRLSLFGEAAMSANKAKAMVVGKELDFGNTEAILIYRNYSARYQSFFGNAFGEFSGAPRNEEGFYAGIRHRLSRKFILSAYADHYRHPASRFSISSPGIGRDYLGLMEVDFDRLTEFYVLLRHEVRSAEYRQSDLFGREVRMLGEAGRSSIRSQLQKQVSSQLRLRTRIEVARQTDRGESTEFGFLLFQDIRWQPMPGLNLDSRLTFFQTDAFDARLYQFENDLRFVMTNALLNGEGQRFYVLLSLDLGRYAELSAKYAVTLWEDSFEMGSGLDHITGNRRSNVGIQFRLKI